LEIPTNNSGSHLVNLGDHIQLELHYRSGALEVLEFDLVPDELVGKQPGLLGISTPLAKSILNEKAGLLIPYFTEEIISLKILEITPSTINIESLRDLPRENPLEDIKAQIEFREAQLFAASGNTKWGSYDPDGLNYEIWKQSPGASTNDKKEDTA
jgi:hypothetical protein